MATDIQKRDAWKFVNCQVKAQNLIRKNFENNPDIYVLFPSNHIHIGGVGVERLCELLDMPYVREDWDGNEHCGTNNDILYFDYKGYRFFSLIDRGKVK